MPQHPPPQCTYDIGTNTVVVHNGGTVPCGGEWVWVLCIWCDEPNSKFIISYRLVTYSLCHPLTTDTVCVCAHTNTVHHNFIASCDETQSIVHTHTTAGGGEWFGSCRADLWYFVKAGLTSLDHCCTILRIQNAANVCIWVAHQLPSTTDTAGICIVCMYQRMLLRAWPSFQREFQLITNALMMPKLMMTIFMNWGYSIIKV